MANKNMSTQDHGSRATIETRGYQQEMLDESLRQNIVLAMDTGSGKTHIAVLRLKHESEREMTKLSWFLAPTVALCEQQCNVIKEALPVSVGLISGALAPEQWKDANLWKSVLSTHRVMVSTPQVLLDALRHGYIVMGVHIGLIIFDEAHHAVDNDPYNRIMQEFYHKIPPRDPSLVNVASRHVRAERPMILGLTASPIFGGNVDKAFQTIERNLDSRIVSPRQHRSELEEFVHRPIFKHIMYNPVDIMNPPFSANFAALQDVQSKLEIENDPYIKSLRNQLSKITPGTPEYYRLDQKLSKTIANEGTFTHKGLRDFVRTASEILYDVGVWAAEWYIWEVIQQAKKAGSDRVMPSWGNEEKAYLLSVINQINLKPVSYDDIVDNQSDKVTALLECLFGEKEDAEAENESFSGLVFVQRRDVVLALAELLKHHPVTQGNFQVGPLLGASDSSQRHAFLDITRGFIKQSQEKTIMDFKLGDLNLLISTSVAEEGIDVQACGCVIRFDLPQNMASWAQSRGRARKKRSTFIMMFQNGSLNHEDVMKWEKLEAEMVARYMDPSRNPSRVENDIEVDDITDDDVPPLQVESTGASVSLQSAIPHLNHFCAVMPHRGHFVYQPLYDLDPPDYPIGWHSFDNRAANPYTGPWSATVTLPRVLPQHLRVFSTQRIYPTKDSAYRHAAFETYKALYNANLLNDNLLPLVDEDDPEIEELKKEIEKRTGMASVSLQMDPWAPDTVEEEGSEVWFISELMIGDLPPIHVLTRRQAPLWTRSDEIKLYHPSLNTLELRMEPVGKLEGSDERIAEAREYTRMIFWSLNGSRMKWDDVDFPYLFFCPMESSSPQWNTRRAWGRGQSAVKDSAGSQVDFIVPASQFGKEFHYPDDISMVYKGFKAYEFVRWRWDPLSEEEEVKLLEQHSQGTASPEIHYPLLEVRPFHPRTNFLIPRRPEPPSPPSSLFFLPQHSSVALISKSETNYAFLLPSILRALTLHLTMDSLRSNLFTDRSPLSMIPNSLLITALCAPVSGEPKNYQRLETLGDTVLKFVVSLQLLAEYPLWLEGYLSRKKDHAVSNVRLAKENVTRELYKWIIRDRMLGRKWKPLYISNLQTDASKESSPKPRIQSETDAMDIEPQSNPHSERPPKRDEQEDIIMASADNPTSSEDALKDDMEIRRKKKKEERKEKKKNSQELSTKVLADVVESLIGAAYIYGGFSFGYECTKFFQLNLNSWQPLPDRISSILERSDESFTTLLSNSPFLEEVQFPAQLSNVEKLIGYTFLRPILLLEALTHPSCQDDHGGTISSISYERMEFLGDAVLDMVVSDFLFHAQGKDGTPKEYSPGHMFLRKSALVNSHILAFVCLKSKMEVWAKMPKAYALNDSGDDIGNSKKQRYRGEQKIVLEEEQHTVHLYKCLLHSSPRILEDQHLTYGRFVKRESEIVHALEEERMFPWAALTRMQAPKFFSDMVESILGAVYLDSEGNLDVVKEVMRSLGLYQILERVVREDVDVLHPVSRLSLWASKQKPEAKKITYDYRKEKGRVSCGILLDGVELEGSRVDDIERGKASQEEVRLAAAEEAIRKLKLRDVGVEYELLKRKTKKKSKTKGKGRDTEKQMDASESMHDNNTVPKLRRH
ncbi:P-loop containing nucleoside triphosphate hydrolase protein [Gymnopus androsaceus JB14]|uniref:P-loop containing nucleoside triphosphate hydrolase protein n=1 Tax=Gymnopus androsaceus JB14 TaxID=1447944 RepID=A0A6A4I225_9AGAR|nr:P-loop containing nucleoside triphosphate hydrolase protein [Gymnopus androsaceus JB14]